ncbi:MAG: acyloxyacyl hydrolase [Candidatus Omnitrophica bacterium]|nr:acyloxyacyl hydrolase [Candidatus Omnitrophota bacterium]MDD5236724.1 acyloxyacyl hydrolase [Candidatus Omnitrophota bacterium]MDD5610067.1 acyloxyacyl hydrolase [Candidatus Omnitrophota bacterium]
MIRKFLVVVLCLLALNLFSGVSKASDGKKSCIKELGILTGYATGNLKNKEHYELVPTILRIGFDLKPVLHKINNFNPKGLVEFELEPFASTVISPNNNAEVGFGLLFKYAYPVTERLYPYIEGGVGFIYITQHTLEQSTQYNFTPQGGVGLTYFLKKDRLALNVGYRYRHLSNASIKSPNSGINVDMGLLGLSLFY